MGGDLDGMGELDNAPMPPMGPDDMGGEPPMGPDDMGGEPPMGEPSEDFDTPNENNGENDELLDIINDLSIEDKAAVTKYAKSMIDDSGDDEESVGDESNVEDEMPMESRRNIKGVIDEVINDILYGDEGSKRPEKKLPKQYNGMKSPFKSNYNN